LGGFIPTCHTQTFVEVAKLELKMDNKFRRPRVSGWEEDGCYLTVEYTQENGERVRGIFKRFGWEKAPSSVNADTRRRLKNGPIHVIGSGAGPR
jgi:hypothetical protein